MQQIANVESTRAYSPATLSSADGPNESVRKPVASLALPPVRRRAITRHLLLTRSRRQFCGLPAGRAREQYVRPLRPVGLRRSSLPLLRPATDANAHQSERTLSAPRARCTALLEGTVIDTVLTNRLDGSGPAPVNCLVTNPVYSHSGQHVLIPAGARVLGETRPVQALGETRLAVAFHRLLMPDGSTLRLDQFLGLNQIGDAGLRDKVNHHYWSTFGAAAAVGLISGLAQWIGTAGFSDGPGDRTVIIAGGADAASQASLQVMSRFLNRLPTVTIREGHRVKVYVTSDLELPAYPAAQATRF